MSENTRLLQGPARLGVPRFAVYPGKVMSRSDGQLHFIGFGRLCKLYGIRASEAIDMSLEINQCGIDLTKLQKLRPRYDGNYTMPNT